jgi:hypothetical protein
VFFSDDVTMLWVSRGAFIYRTGRSAHDFIQLAALDLVGFREDQLIGDSGII